MTEVALPRIDSKSDSERVGLMLLRPGSLAWDATIDLEAEVFEERGYVESKAELEKEYAPYIPETELLSMKHGHDLTGCLRIIDYDPKIGLKTIHDIEAGRLMLSKEGKELLRNLDLNSVFEVGTIALKKEHRKSIRRASTSSNFLYAGVVDHSRKHNKPYALASFDADYFDSFQKGYGGVYALGPAVNYMGSPTIPALINIEGVVQHLKDTGNLEAAYILESGGDLIKDDY